MPSQIRGGGIPSAHLHLLFLSFPLPKIMDYGTVGWKVFCTAGQQTAGLHSSRTTIVSKLSGGTTLVPLSAGRRRSGPVSPES